jgi:hypothetical protein
MRHTHEHMERLGLDLGPEYKELVAEAGRQAADNRERLNIANLAVDADLPSWAGYDADEHPTMGQFLYGLLFRMFTGSSHADLQAALIVANADPSVLAPTNCSVTAIAGFAVLAAVTEPLDLERHATSEFFDRFWRDLAGAVMA